MKKDGLGVCTSTCASRPTDLDHRDVGSSEVVRRHPDVVDDEADRAPVERALGLIGLE